jgi:glyoxylase-like metal-dependent hydrolase (beta-lactamase superfamily II)
VLVRSSDSLGLIDVGYGGKLAAKFRLRYSLEDGAPLERNLAAMGVIPDEIDWVVLTHLHFDHAGGATHRDENGRLHPVFPRARHVVQRVEWDDAIGNSPELAGAYYHDDFAPLEVAGLLDLVEGDVEVIPGVIAQLTSGHTRGHQIVRLESADASAVCLADLCPTTHHLPTFWTMAYDQFPLAVRREKPLLLNDVCDHRRIALFSHDPRVAAGRLSRDSDDEWAVVQV